MPLVTISLFKSWSTEDQKLIADGIHEAIVGVGFPQTDRFQKIQWCYLLRPPKKIGHLPMGFNITWKLRTATERKSKGQALSSQQ